MSSIAEKTVSENEFHSTRENTPLDDKEKLNGTYPKLQLHNHNEENMENGGMEMKASTDQSHSLEARNGNVTGDSRGTAVFM